MKNSLYAVLLMAVFGCSGCNGNKTAPYATAHDWSEPIDPAQSDPALWGDVTAPGASFGSVDIRYPLSEPYNGPVSKSHTLTGWKGEKVHAQIVVWTPSEIEDLVCTTGDFTGKRGKTLAGAVRARFVKYVLSDWFDPDNKCGARKPGEPSRLQADLLDEAPSLTIAARTTRPVWITVEIPRNTPAGKYKGAIKLKGKGFYEKLTLELDIIDRTLPQPSEWAYHLDLWQHPAAVARIEDIPVWSDAHFEAMKPVMKLLAEAGQKVITATVNKDPWNNQCYDAYADMIVWTRHPDVSWEYDFTVFDRWVEFMLDLGVDKMINCYSMLPWNNMLHYKDGLTGQFVDVKADPGTPEFRMMWEPFLPAFENHLREKGWLKITNIAMDERSSEHMAEATAVLSEAAPELGIALADNHKIFKKYPYIKDMCAAIFGPIEHADILERRAMGLNTTYYVCCSSEFPNTFTFSDPAEAVYYAWYTAAYDYDGFLRWSYNSWTEDPIRDSRFRTWAAGDTYIVYPEARSSIRFERLIEGIQDFEKMRILKAESPIAAAAIDTLLLAFRTNRRDWDWNGTLNVAKKQINAISRK